MASHPVAHGVLRVALQGLREEWKKLQECLGDLGFQLPRRILQELQRHPRYHRHRLCRHRRQLRPFASACFRNVSMRAFARTTMTHFVVASEVGTITRGTLKFTALGA